MHSYSRKRSGIKGKRKKSELVVSSAKMKAIDFERLNVSYHDSPCKQTLSLKDLIKQIIFNG